MYLGLCSLAASVVLAACGSESLSVAEPPHDFTLPGSLADGVSPADSQVILGQLGGAPTAAVAATSAADICTLTWRTANRVVGCAAPVPAVVPAVPWLQH